jgi:hypothetical protein
MAFLLDVIGSTSRFMHGILPYECLPPAYDRTEAAPVDIDATTNAACAFSSDHYP